MRGFTVGFGSALAAVLWLRTDVAIGIAVMPWIYSLILLCFSKRLQPIIIGMCVGGALAHAMVYQQLALQLRPSLDKTDLTVVGTVISVPKHDSRRTSFLFRIDKVEDPKEGSWPEQVRLSWYGGQRKMLKAGDQWRLAARLKPTTSLGNPGGFNYEQWLFYNRIHATGYVRDAPAPQKLQQRSLNLHAVRESLANKIMQLPSANEYAGLVQGLTVGITSSISQEQWHTLRQSGTAHLLAISGLHVGLVSGWFYMFAGFVWRLVHASQTAANRQRCIKPIFALCASCISATLYAGLAGFSLPTQRALIMLTVFALTVMLRRIWPPGTAMIIALFMVLFVDPLAVLSVGFWLSFGTVAALFYLHSGRLSRLGSKSGALWLHLKLGIVLLPATAWFFQQGSLIAPVANAIAVPLVGLFVVPASLVTALVAPLWSTGANALLSVNQWVLAKLLSMLDWLLTLPASSLPLFLPGPLVLFCALVGLLNLFSPRSLRLRWMTIPLLAPAIVLNLVGKQVKGLELHVLDVGQGLSTVLFTENHTVLFDTGKRISDNDTMLDRVVRPFLISQGRSKIDVSIISHADDDHAGGVESLLAMYPQTQLYASDEQQVLGLDAEDCIAGKTFVLDDVTFAFIHPGSSDLGSRNNLSCVLLVHYGNTRLLLTGDIESESERLLVERLEKTLSLTVLVAPHHGSRSSSTPAFVSMLPAEIVIFAAGENNKFNFPHQDVVSRYRDTGAAVFTTGQLGALFLRFDKNGLAAPVEWFWQNKRRYRR